MGGNLTTEEFIAKARLVHGDKYDYSKVEYKNNKTKVCIICPEHGEFWQRPNDHLTGHSCRRCSRSLGKVFGVGVNDCYEFIRTGDKIRSSYQSWVNMLQRCYSIAWHKRHPTYIGCQVCDEWLYYSNFKRWSDENYRDGYELDKDILAKKAKLYSPVTCVFVPHYINSLVIKRMTQNKKDIEKNYAHIKEVANRALLCGDIDQRVYSALLSYDSGISPHNKTLSPEI